MWKAEGRQKQSWAVEIGGSREPDGGCSLMPPIRVSLIRHDGLSIKRVYRHGGCASRQRAHWPLTSINSSRLGVEKTCIKFDASHGYPT